MKHDNYYSYLLSTLLEPSYLGMILSSCIAKLVSCDFHNLLECSNYALLISTVGNSVSKFRVKGSCYTFSACQGWACCYGEEDWGIEGYLFLHKYRTILFFSKATMIKPDLLQGGGTIWSPMFCINSNCCSGTISSSTLDGISCLGTCLRTKASLMDIWDSIPT